MLKEPRLRLFHSGLDLGVTMDAEVTMRDEIWNNDSIGDGGSLCGDLCSRGRKISGFGDLDSDRYARPRVSASRRPKSMKDSRDALLESPDHRSYPEQPSGGRFLSCHLRQSGEGPRSGGNRLP